MKNEKGPKALTSAATATRIVARSTDLRLVTAFVYAANPSRARDLMLVEECVCGTSHHFFSRHVSSAIRKRCPVTHEPILLMPKVRRFRAVRRAA